MLDLPAIELRIPPSGRWVRFTLRLAASGPIDASPASSPIWHGLASVAAWHVTSCESNFEKPSAPNPSLTSTRQGDKANSHPKEEGGPSHDDIEL